MVFDLGSRNQSAGDLPEMAGGQFTAANLGSYVFEYSRRRVGKSEEYRYSRWFGGVPRSYELEVDRLAEFDLGSLCSFFKLYRIGGERDAVQERKGQHRAKH